MNLTTMYSHHNLRGMYQQSSEALKEIISAGHNLGMVFRVKTMLLEGRRGRAATLAPDMFMVLVLQRKTGVPPLS